MARYYSDENIKILEDECAHLRWRSLQLQQRCMGHQFRNEQAKEFALHGFLRRLGTLVRCIENTFCAIPPELDGVPTSNQTQDVAIQVQGFIFNVFGCLDNLAWMWVLERNVTKPDGAPLPPEWIGLRAANRIVRDSLGQELHQCLESMSDWFKYLEDYRHALAHRIPLYVPPFSIAPDKADRYCELERSIFDLIVQRKKAEAQAQQLERDSLRFFQPCIMHSWTGEARPIQFHTQMLTDFKTIEMIAAKLLDDLAIHPT
ncbi:hypothetical protein RZS28_13285 [Methylocapsa polymorpha]|uniref:Cthe-2314-like HEPN domain-containing protein n=1 Tax=Methylocapsa polymorpha TaxID=3080828 RepID=A0ABZ0HNA1_9HYPH|nr:hypothetical protein RZS28_13285 [Methylocapsa sp. RX1]